MWVVDRMMRSRKENCGKSSVGVYCKQHNYQLSEVIQNLTPELREIIYKEYLAIKKRPKKEMGWDEAYYDIEEAPFCEKRSRIVKVMFCRKCDRSCINGLCFECYKNGVKHYLGYPVYDENDYDQIFQKFF